MREYEIIEHAKCYRLNKDEISVITDSDMYTFWEDGEGVKFVAGTLESIKPGFYHKIGRKLVFIYDEPCCYK